jgi:hypothetical protein
LVSNFIITQLKVKAKLACDVIIKANCESILIKTLYYKKNIFYGRKLLKLKYNSYISALKVLLSIDHEHSVIQTMKMYLNTCWFNFNINYNIQ